MHLNISVTKVVIPWRTVLPLVLLCYMLGLAAHVQARGAILISKNINVIAANNHSYSGDISADGKLIVYASSASDLVLGDHNNLPDIFIYDVDSNKTELLSVTAKGDDSNGASSIPVISADGQFVVFASAADNLVEGDQNGAVDIFMYHRAERLLERISSLDKSGAEFEGRGPSQIDISGDGRFVVFDTTTDNLVYNDNNNLSDVFLYDRVTGVIDKISNASSGKTDADGGSYHAVISENGQFIAFESMASNLVSNDTNALSDVFVYDRNDGGMTRISVNSAGDESKGASLRPQISEGGQFVSFYSKASNLVEDTHLRNSHLEMSDGIYLHDKGAGRTQLLTLGAGDHWPSEPINPKFNMSANANYIVFSSKAQNITEYWTGLCDDSGTVNCFWRDRDNVFLYNRLTAHTELISVNSFGFPLDANSVEPSVSEDGKFVSFTGSDYGPEYGISTSQLNLGASWGLLATYLIAPGGDLFEDYPSYTWANREEAIAYRLSTSDTLIQPWISVNEAECNDGICLTTPLMILDYGLHSVFVQYATELGEVSPLSEPVSIFKRPATPSPDLITTDISKIITLTWSDVPDVIDYRLKVRDKTTGEIILDYRVWNPELMSYTLPFTLNSEHTYQWKIKAQEPSGRYSSWTPIYHRVASSIPTPIYPEGVIDDFSPTFQWISTDNAEGYRVRIQDVDTGETVINKYIGNQLTYTFDNILKSGHRYRWKVRTQNPDGNYSKWSYFEFTDARSLPSVTNTVTLTWAVPDSRVDGSLLQPGDISQYIVVYQKEQEAIKGIIIEDVRLTELTLEDLSDGDYQFKIKVVDKMGLASDFSEGAKITLPRSVK